jgi:hypothetical protein
MILPFALGSAVDGIAHLATLDLALWFGNRPVFDWRSRLNRIRGCAVKAGLSSRGCSA